MFIRKNWVPISVFLLAIVCVGLYWTQTQTPKEPRERAGRIEAQRAQMIFNTLNTASLRQERILSVLKRELSYYQREETRVRRWINSTDADRTDALAIAVASACDLKEFSRSTYTALAARKALKSANLNTEMIQIYQKIYDKESDILMQTEKVQRAVTNRNLALQLWDDVLGRQSPMSVDGKPVLPKEVPPDYERSRPQRPADPVSPDAEGGVTSQGEHWSDAYLPPIKELKRRYADDAEALFVLNNVEVIHKHGGLDSVHPEAVKAKSLHHDFFHTLSERINIRGNPEGRMRAEELLKLQWSLYDSPPGTPADLAQWAPLRGE